MSPELVTVATYPMPYQAHLAKTHLEAEGIPAFIQDEHLNSIDWLYTPALGGIRLQVAQDQLEEARKVLETPIDFDLEEMEIVAGPDADALPGRGTPTTHCPHCGGQGFVETDENALDRFVNALLLGIPYFWFGRPYLCRACGKTFRKR